MPFAGDLGESCGFEAGVLVLGVPPSGSGEEVGGVVLSMITKCEC
jgi:hypothetical protein